MQDQVDEMVTPQEKILFSTKRVTVKETAKGFQYLERNGKDSVAIFLIRCCERFNGEFEVLVRYQPLCVDNSEIDGVPRLFPCPFTGSIDPDELPEAAAKRETYEESGFAVEVLSLGKYIVGTQTNEICYLFYADVTGVEPQPAPQDGSYFEAISRNQWRPLEYLNQCDYGACQLGYFRLKAMLVI